MNYVEQITTLPKEESTKSIIDALNSKAFDTLNSVELLDEINLMHGIRTAATYIAKARDLTNDIKTQAGITPKAKTNGEKITSLLANKVIDNYKY